MQWCSAVSRIRWGVAAVTFVLSILLVMPVRAGELSLETEIMNEFNTVFNSFMISVSRESSPARTGMTSKIDSTNVTAATPHRIRDTAEHHCIPAYRLK